jgi:hypothetical protein
MLCNEDIIITENGKFKFFFSDFVMSYSIISGNSTHTKEVLYTQNKFVRIITGGKMEAHCRELFSVFNILPVVNEFFSYR